MTRLSQRVSSLAPSIIREMSYRRKPTSIDLSIGEPKLTPADDILDSAWKKLRSGPQGYTHNAGLAELREVIAKHYSFEGRESLENVIVTVGSEEAVCLAMMSTLNPGDEVLFPSPGYPAYSGLAKLLGATAVPYRISRETGLVPRAEEIASCLTDKTRVLILNGPSNPFGMVDSKDELEKIAQLVDERDLVVISDEIYREIYFDAEPPPSIVSLTERSIFVSGLSKCCAMTGLRLGYLIAGRDFVKQTTLAHQLLVTCAPRLAQLAALEVFRQPEYLRQQVPYYAETRQVIREFEAQLPEDTPLILGNGAFYASIDVSRRTKDPLSFAIKLLEEKDVVVVPGVAFGEEGDWFWRMSYAAGPDTVREGLCRVSEFLSA